MCKQDLCENDYKSHSCQSHQVPSDLTSMFQMFRQGFEVRQPSPQDYEMQLRASPQILTTGRESLDLIIATGLIFLVIGFRSLLLGTQTFTEVLMWSIAITPAFIIHELAHKYSAIFYGKYARFALIKQMTLLTIIVAFSGIGIAGPGATMIMGRSNERERGIFAASGPAINAILAYLSFVLLLVFNSIPFIASILSLSIFVNAFLGLFNLIPISLLDGKKVMGWNSSAWVLLVLANLGAFLLSGFYQIV